MDQGEYFKSTHSCEKYYGKKNNLRIRPFSTAFQANSAVLLFGRLRVMYIKSKVATFSPPLGFLHIAFMLK